MGFGGFLQLLFIGLKLTGFIGWTWWAVKSKNSNINNMRAMFYGSQASILDLSKLDTSNVTNMQYMFSKSMATTIDLSNFDGRTIKSNLQTLCRDCNLGKGIKKDNLL